MRFSCCCIICSECSVISGTWTFRWFYYLYSCKCDVGFHCLEESGIGMVKSGLPFSAGVKLGSVSSDFFFFNSFHGISLVSANITKVSEDSNVKNPPLSSPSPLRRLSCLVLDILLAWVMVTLDFSPMLGGHYACPTYRTKVWLLFSSYVLGSFLDSIIKGNIFFSQCSNTIDFCKNSDAFKKKLFLF